MAAKRTPTQYYESRIEQQLTNAEKVHGKAQQEYRAAASADERALNKANPQGAYQFYQQQELAAQHFHNTSGAQYFHNLATGVQPLTQSQQSVYDVMNATLKSWNLESLAPDLKNLIQKGDTQPDTLALALSETQAYQQRFSGNKLRRAAGLPDLSPADYLAAEASYRQVLASYGLPKGFYDTPQALAGFIGADVSPSELDARAKIAHDQYEFAPGYVKALWSQYFGGKGDAIAAILDPKVATQVIQDRSNMVAIGGAAAQVGLSVSGARAKQLAQAGVTQAQAQKAYSQISETQGIDQSIAQRFGTTFDQTQEENDLLLGQGQATLKRQSLYDEEQGLFKAQPGTSQQSLGVKQTY